MTREEAPLLTRAFASMRGCLLGRMAIVLGAVAFSVILHLLPRRVANQVAAWVTILLLTIALSGGKHSDDDRKATDDYDFLDDNHRPDATNDDGFDAHTFRASAFLYLSYTVTTLLICTFVVEDVIPACLNHLTAAAQALFQLGSSAPAVIDLAESDEEFDEE
ncbi:hypothetical protein SDRG_10419 [Saprolegnia diclina VS20]|uniref:Uncharacterized protein n=1 Tax=Saprolegnia diclina (strain VS20) TaxID=1156394 RepID=T0QB68_SAPDV|nr:hypothetical protein SDRG_10419 [Saprolegnia diclina VS20]EQC31901.1 hypothetical protein SDRG_10419 [Saprolegnia diclina VS20]|eukprot:XP_008614629.1 hypothetical protein SDRG_10419 [Saprolegnia diclina VS20]